MKRFKLLAVLAALAIVGPRWGFAATRIEGGTLLDSTGLAYNLTGTGLNTDNLNNLSLFATYSTATFSAATLSDGRKSTATITVTTNGSLAAAKAAVKFTIINPSSTTWVGVTLTLNGISYREGAGKEWRAVDTATGTAVNIAAAIDADTRSSLFDSVSVSTVVFATATVAGVGANSWAAVTSAPTVISTSAPTFTGGADNARLSINGTVLDAGTDYTVGATAALTAKAISDAIMARSALTAIITSTWTSGGIVFATATVVGVNAYTTFTSTPAALTVNGSLSATTGTFLNGLASDISTASVFNKNKHLLTLGLGCLLTVPSGTAPQNLVSGTTYFIVPTDANNFKLASSQTNAIAGTTLTVSTFTGAGSITLTPLAIATVANNGFKFQVSNDNSNWFDLNVTSVTLTSSSSSTSFWDLGTPAYRWIRALFVGPTQGGYAVTITANGRQN